MLPQPQPQPQSYQHYHDQQMNVVQSCFEPPAKVGVGQVSTFQHQQVPQNKPFPGVSNGVNVNNGEHQHFLGHQTGGQFGGNYYSGTFHQFPSQTPPANVTGPKNVDMAPAPHPFHQSVMAPVPAASAPTHHHQPATIASAAPHLSNQHQNPALQAQVHQHQQQGQIASVNANSFGNSSPPSIAQTPPLISPYSPPSVLSGELYYNLYSPSSVFW
jgi:hypothetical protein